MAVSFKKLKVLEVRRETSEAVTLCFERPDSPDFGYIPGQYLTLRVHIQGKNYNRAYSLCSSPKADKNLMVTVKATPGGVVSNYLNEHFHAGNEMEVMPPMGNFVAKLNPTNRKHYVLIGAGSGITPLMSILKTVMLEEPESSVSLLYGNRSQNGIIFNSELESLAHQYDGRLEIIHHLTQPTHGYNGYIGRIGNESIREYFKTIPFNKARLEFFICGPSPMMAEAYQALKDNGINADQIHQEHFSAPIAIDEPVNETIVSPAGKDDLDGMVTIICEGQEIKVKVSKNQSILDAALDGDLDPPYACMIGSCCTCKAKVMAGKVMMDDREGLTDSEINDGYVLTCQSHPITNGVIISYDA